MSEIEKFKKTYINEKKLEETLEEIEMKDISNIKKLELKQQAKEEKKENDKNSIFRLDPNVEVMEDTYMDELVEGWGRGYRYRD